MGKKAPSPPPAPDPTVVANAQAAANQQTAKYQQQLNMIDTTGPDGTVNYVASDAPGGYTQTTTLSPEQQAIYNAGTQAQAGALGIANDQLGRINSALSTPLSTDGLQALSGGVDLSHLGAGQGIQYSFNPGQAVQGQVGPQDLFGTYQAASNSAYQQAASRLDPQWSNAQNDLQTQLANQGLGVGSTAYTRAMDDFNRQKTDAYNQAIYGSQTQGLNAENTLFGQSLNQGQFANAAAAQMYGQNQGLAAFNNEAQNQAFGQNVSGAQLALQNAQFGNQARNQGLQEQAYLQNQPINQFDALMSQNQVQGPQGVQYSPTSVNPTDVLGAYALNTQANQASYQAQLQNQASGMGGLFNLGSALIGGAAKAGGWGFLSSDRRLKTHIRKVGRLDNGVPLYSYRYVGQPTTHVGVMAQELAKVRPDLVHEVGGFLAVDYAGL